MLTKIVRNSSQIDEQLCVALENDPQSPALDRVWHFGWLQGESWVLDRTLDRIQAQVKMEFNYAYKIKDLRLTHEPRPT